MRFLIVKKGGFQKPSFFLMILIGCFSTSDMHFSFFFGDQQNDGGVCIIAIHCIGGGGYWEGVGCGATTFFVKAGVAQINLSRYPESVRT